MIVFLLLILVFYACNNVVPVYYLASDFFELKSEGELYAPIPCDIWDEGLQHAQPQPILDTDSFNSNYYKTIPKQKYTKSVKFVTDASLWRHL